MAERRFVSQGRRGAVCPAKIGVHPPGPQRGRTVGHWALSWVATCFLLSQLAGGSEQPPEALPRTGAQDPRLASFDRMLVEFIRQRALPGGALAVVKDGRLVLARGYGWADRERRTPVVPDALFRIASLSKPVTAVAVLKLVDGGRLALDDRVADLLDVRPVPTDNGKVDDRLRTVTVWQLLQHTGGFDRQRSFDPMFRSLQIAQAVGRQPPAEPGDIIRYMWGRPLDFDPGTRYAYSNFGYCVLGRVIERVSGRPYEQYVRDEVLIPLGIADMRIGRTLREDRDPREVCYYDRPGVRQPAVVGCVGEPVEPPYGAWYLEAMDAHGGWLASAVDMARFAAAWDESSAQTVLSPAMRHVMFARPPYAAQRDEHAALPATYYGCGWSVRPRGPGRANHWHTGSLPGTAALMVRRHDGLCWVVLFNSRYSAGDKGVIETIDPLLHRAADEVRDWPDIDLFPQFLRNEPQPEQESSRVGA